MEVEEEEEETDDDEKEGDDELEAKALRKKTKKRKKHFEPSEVGMLAKCLCILLVSIRVGKINKQGTLLCPTGIRNCIMSYMPWTDLNKIIGTSNRKRTTQMLLKEVLSHSLRC
ncbi:uncharacterized protein LOC114311576 isoform X2 [Camellia sinensis]|uniref:uncharacterized protein LOC114311576 isoform X2 n=1 Tax=Camellia sinensis TaxID=4442 RepID=UPI0010364E53|nr:uncharacterized protein LOC114311576 isoform X2 [Camellia sinensis]